MTGTAEAKTAEESVVVLGAGIAGLCVALALAPTGRRVTLLERDPPPPAGDPDAVFEHWRRRGASQLRHSHAFLARLRSLIASDYPDLLAALRAAGARDLTFAEGLPDPLRAIYTPAAGDEQLAVLISRRSTLEQVIRTYVEAQPNVQIRSGVFADGLVGRRRADGDFVVSGFSIEGGSPVEADLVIDAGGRGSAVNDWLRTEGVAPPEQSTPCGILYYTRFFALLPGQTEPPRGAHPTNGDLTYLKFGTFPADRGTFSITLAVPEVEERLRAAVVRPEIYDAICARLPGVAPWTDPARSAPVSKVHAMGELESRWREMAPGGRALTLNLFCVGDSLVRTNPLFGRGCSFAAVEAHLLRDVLAQTRDPAKRARLYSHRVRQTLSPFYRSMETQDRDAVTRARRLIGDGAPAPRRIERLARRFFEDGVAIALREDLVLLRAAMRAFHMLDPPQAWLQRPGNLARIIKVWARGKTANAHLYTAAPGPRRDELLPALGLALEPGLTG